MILNKKRVFICLFLIVVFLVVSILMVSSIDLFSMSKKSLNIESKKLTDMINTSSLTKFLSSADKLRILDYFLEYERLKANLVNLSFDELNRFMFLGDYLSKYFSVKDLGMSKDLLNKILEQFGKVSKVSKSVESKNILGNGNIKDKSSINENINSIRKEILNLYNNNKISADTCEKVLDKLDGIEYKIDLSSIDGRDISIDLNDISNILDREKSSYSLDADLSVFSSLDKDLLDVQKSVDSISYISDFLNRNIGAINGEDVDISLGDYSSQIGNVLNNVDVGSFSNLLSFVGEDVSERRAKPINFSKTISLPKVTIEGTMKDAWDINMNTSGFNFSNVIKPIDMSLIPNDFLENKLDSIVNVKVPGLDLTKIIKSENSNIPDDSNNSKDSSVSKDLNKPGKIEKDSNKLEGKSNSKKSNSSNTVFTKNNFKKVVIVFIIGICALVIVVVCKNIRKSNLKPKESYEDFQSKEFNIDNDMPKNYKQRLIEEGINILDIVNKNCLKEDKMLTPREVIFGFMSMYPNYDKVLCNKFLRYFEESTFYNLEVDEDIYLEFNALCKEIFSLTKIKGGYNEKNF